MLFISDALFHHAPSESDSSTDATRHSLCTVVEYNTLDLS